jgi:NAD-dependent dihydropyrimidine dehydrogenase PreA subunit
MIEIISKDRCIKCNICVQVCPLNVFDFIQDDTPIISRKSDCQTCFLCEAYCPADALYVSPKAEEDSIKEENITFGSYRASLGWGENQQPTARLDCSHKLVILSQNLNK